jgi:hypothetical protein
MVKLTEFFCFDDILLIMFLYSFVVSIPREGHVPLTMSDLDFMQSTMASPFSIDKKQLTMYQKQSFLMAASAKSICWSQTFPAIVHQPCLNVVLKQNIVIFWVDSICKTLFSFKFWNLHTICLTKCLTHCFMSI